MTGLRGLCVPRKHGLPSSYTDQAAMAAPHSQWIGVDVYWAFHFTRINPKSGKPACPERTSCWWTDGREFRIMARADIRAIILDGSPSTPWAMWVTTSYKKHGSIRSPVNAPPRGAIGFDELRVDAMDDKKVMEWWEIMTTAQMDGIGRRMQEEVSCPPGLLKKVGLGPWMKFKKWAYIRRNDPLYRLLCYLLPSQEDLKNAQSGKADGC